MLLKTLVIAALFSASVCHANIVVINIVGLPGVYENGTYNGFATATVAGIPNQLLLCDDSAHTTYVPSGDLVYDFSSLPTLQYARFAPALQKYEEAAVLLYELAQVQSSDPNYNDVVTEYQYAVWTLFSNSHTLADSNLLVASQGLQTTALAYVTGTQTAPSWLKTAYAELAIYTPDSTAANLPIGNASNQEFLALNPAPEPAMGWVIAFIGCAAGIVKLRRRRA